MKAIATFWFLLILIAGPLDAKNLETTFSTATFYNRDQGSFLETYLKVWATTAEYRLTAKGFYQASLRVTITIKSDSATVAFKEYDLLSMELKDTLSAMPDFTDLQRFPLEKGIYKVEMSVTDNNARESKKEQSFDVALEYTDKLLKFSDLQLVDYFNPTKEENLLSKSGYDLVPYVGDYYPQSVSVMNGYIELYNLDKMIGENQDFLFRYFVESAKDTLLIDNLIKVGRHKSASVNPLLFTISISGLPHGYYHLVVEAVDRNNQVLAKQKVRFFRTNPGLQVDEAVIKTIDITSTFAEQIQSVDSLKFYLLSMIPVATSGENLYIGRLVQTDNVLQMQKTLYSFWKKRNDEYPGAEWNHYKKQVMAIEERYKTKIKHGFETDMGYTWLRYGTPDQVEDSKHEPLAAPYIIWKYFHIENQSDVRFVFTNPHLVGTEYFLIYSNARDNPYNRGWDRDVYERTSGFGSKGGWGSRIQSNFDR